MKILKVAEMRESDPPNQVQAVLSCHPCQEMLSTLQAIKKPNSKMISKASFVVSGDETARGQETLSLFLCKVLKKSISASLALAVTCLNILVWDDL